MSNASDPKVEDVLSSVRRLVSNELPKTPRTALPRGDSALVLTEAQRVESAKGGATTGRSLEQRIAELEAAVTDQDDEFEPDGSEDQAQHQPDRIVYTRPPSNDEVASRMARRLSQIALIETGPANEDADAISDASPSFRHVTEAAPEPIPEAPMAEDVPTERRTSADVEAFSDPDDMAANIDARIASGRPISEPLQLVEPTVPAPVGPPEADTEDFDAALSAAVKASITAAETESPEEVTETDDAEAVERGDVLSAREFSTPHFDIGTSDPKITASEMLADGTGPDEAEADRIEAAVATVVGYADKSLSAPNQDDASEAQAEDETGETAMAAAALDALADEDAVRLLVARLMKDELKGELGQTITRNVRKLVQREVRRTLTSKDLT